MTQTDTKALEEAFAQKMAAVFSQYSVIRNLPRMHFRMTGELTSVPDFDFPVLPKRGKEGIEEDLAELNALSSTLKKIKKDYFKSLDEGFKKESRELLSSLKRELRAIEEAVISAQNETLDTDSLTTLIMEMSRNLYWYDLRCESYELSARGLPASYVKPEIPKELSVERAYEFVDEFFEAIKSKHMFFFNHYMVEENNSETDGPHEDSTPEDAQEMVLIELDRDPKDLAFEVMLYRVAPNKNYFKVPRLALDLLGAKHADYLHLEGVSDTELETLMVLHGGAAYSSFEEALAGARALG